MTEAGRRPPKSPLDPPWSLPSPAHFGGGFPVDAPLCRAPEAEHCWLGAGAGSRVSVGPSVQGTPCLRWAHPPHPPPSPPPHPFPPPAPLQPVLSPFSREARAAPRCTSVGPCAAEQRDGKGAKGEGGGLARAAGKPRRVGSVPSSHPSADLHLPPSPFQVDASQPGSLSSEPCIAEGRQ